MDLSGAASPSTWLIASDEEWLHASCDLAGPHFVLGVRLELDCGPDRRLNVRVLTASGERAPVQRHVGLYGPSELGAHAVATGRRPWTAALVTWSAPYVVRWPEPTLLPSDPDAREWALAGRRVWAELVGTALTSVWATLESVWSAHLDLVALPAAESAGGSVALYNQLVADPELCRYVEIAPVLGHLSATAPIPAGEATDRRATLESRLQEAMAFRARQTRSDTLDLAVLVWARQVTCAPEYWPGLTPGADSALLGPSHVLSVPAVAWQLHDLALTGSITPTHIIRLHAARDWQLVHLFLAMLPRVAARSLRDPRSAWRVIARWAESSDARQAGVAPCALEDVPDGYVPLDVLLAFARWLSACVEADGTGRLRAPTDISLALLVARVRRGRRRTPGALARLLQHVAQHDVPFANPVPAGAVLLVRNGEALLPVNSLTALCDAHELIGGGVGANVAAYQDGRAHLFRIIDDRDVTDAASSVQTSIHRGFIEVSPDGRIRKLWVRGGVGRAAAWWTATESGIRDTLQRHTGALGGTRPVT